MDDDIQAISDPVQKFYDGTIIKTIEISPKLSQVKLFLDKYDNKIIKYAKNTPNYEKNSNITALHFYICCAHEQMFLLQIELEA